MASMISAVATGRLMKSSAMLMYFPLAFHLNPRAGNQADLAVGDDHFAGLDAFFDYRLTADGHPHRHRPRLHRVVLFHDENILPVLAGLHRLRGHDGGVCPRG